MLIQNGYSPQSICVKPLDLLSFNPGIDLLVTQINKQFSMLTGQTQKENSLKRIL